MRASPNTAPEMAATGMPASRNSLALSAAAGLTSISQAAPPGRIRRALLAGCNASNVISGKIRTPPAARTGARLLATVTTRKDLSWAVAYDGAQSENPSNTKRWTVRVAMEPPVYGDLDG